VEVLNDRSDSKVCFEKVITLGYNWIFRQKISAIISYHRHSAPSLLSAFQYGLSCCRLALLFSSDYQTSNGDYGECVE
jgi:hypothetical protein